MTQLCETFGLPNHNQLPDDEATKAEWYDTLVLLCIEVISCGVPVTLQELAGFSPLERQALQEASNVVWTRRAVQAGLAASGHAAEVLSDADDGAAMVREKLNNTLDRLQGVAL